jgi:hypothetical protein
MSASLLNITSTPRAHLFFLDGLQDFYDALLIASDVHALKHLAILAAPHLANYLVVILVPASKCISWESKPKNTSVVFLNASLIRHLLCACNIP